MASNEVQQVFNPEEESEQSEKEYETSESNGSESESEIVIPDFEMNEFN